MKEQTIQRKIIKYLEEQGAYVVKTISTNKKGTPDILACYKGRFIAVEVKAPGKEYNVSELQAYNLRKINESGGYAIATSSLTNVVSLVKRIDNG